MMMFSCMCYQKKKFAVWTINLLDFALMSKPVQAMFLPQHIGKTQVLS